MWLGQVQPQGGGRLCMTELSRTVSGMHTRLDPRYDHWLIIVWASGSLRTGWMSPAGTTREWRVELAASWQGGGRRWSTLRHASLVLSTYG